MEIKRKPARTTMEFKKWTMTRPKSVEGISPSFKGAKASGINPSYKGAKVKGVNPSFKLNATKSTKPVARKKANN